MKEIEETKLLRMLIEEEDALPAPSRREYYVPHYEFTVAIGKDHTATITLDEEAYYELMETEEFEIESNRMVIKEYSRA